MGLIAKLVQKPIAFPYTIIIRIRINSESNSIYSCINIIKYLGKNLSKEERNLYNEDKIFLFFHTLWYLVKVLNCTWFRGLNLGHPCAKQVFYLLYQPQARHFTKYKIRRRAGKTSLYLDKEDEYGQNTDSTKSNM